jgi:acyl carrier protein
MKEQLRKFIVENYLFGQKVEFSDEDSLQERGILDSTGVLELVTFLEDTWHITVADNELLPENLDSISRLAGYLERKLQEPGAAAGASAQAVPAAG